MAYDFSAFLAQPVRYWRSFVACWLLLPAAPYALLAASDAGALQPVFWLLATPALGAALWPVVRLARRGAIGMREAAFWVMAGSALALVVLLPAYNAVTGP